MDELNFIVHRWSKTSPWMALQIDQNGRVLAIISQHRTKERAQEVVDEYKSRSASVEQSPNVKE